LCLLKSIVHQYEDDEKIINSFSSTFKYKVSEGDREHAYNVYKIRHRLAHWSPTQKKEIDEILINLEKYDEERVLIHSIWVDAFLFLFSLLLMQIEFWDIFQLNVTWVITLFSYDPNSLMN